LGKHSFITLIALTLVWIVLLEEISWQAFGIGILSSMVCMYFGSKFLSYEEIKHLNYLRLITYPLFLVGQIYLAGFQVIKVIFVGCRVTIVPVKTKLKLEVLRIILGDTITLIPGSVLLKLDHKDLTVLWITTKNAPVLNKADTEELIKGKIERRLTLAQKIPSKKKPTSEA